MQPGGGLKVVYVPFPVLTEEYIPSLTKPSKIEVMVMFRGFKKLFLSSLIILEMNSEELETLT